MFTTEETELLSRTGPGTKAGRLLRHYWQPVAALADIPVGGAPFPVTVMGEELVLFRDENQRLGLIGLHCAHRGADLSYGRVEGGGLRCIYHGWVFDVNGKCIEQPNEPRAKTFCERVQHPAYPVKTGGGMVFAYMGEGEPPEFPQLECLSAPDTQVHLWKFRERCSYLQGLEGDIDPFHLNFLHRALHRENASDAPGGSAQYFDFYLKGTPRLEVQRTAFGLRIYTMRELEEQAYLRVTNFLMPNAAAVAGPTGDNGYTLLWHVPESDEVHIKYMLNFQRSGTMNHDFLRQAYELHVVPGTDLEPRRKRENRWLQNREEMKTSWYAGLGPSFSVHDNWVTESMGAIYDRSRENLGYSDMAVVAARRQILSGMADMDEGREPLGRRRDGSTNAPMADVVVKSCVIDRAEDYRKEFA